jgi:hypothetical protein
MITAIFPLLHPNNFSAAKARELAAMAPTTAETRLRPGVRGSRWCGNIWLNIKSIFFIRSALQTLPSLGLIFARPRYNGKSAIH